MKLTTLLASVALFFHLGEAYKAAVLESYPITEDTPMRTIRKNLETYRTCIEKAKDQDVDIIVFTEYGLTTLVDNPEGYAIEFTNDNPILKKLSDLASQHAIYIVVNLLEQVKENTKIKYYNTNLVYNRQGQIIGKYRKINLFNEPNLTPGNEMVTFSTDFGVTFGVMTCFDILYHNPSRTLLDNSDVEDIVYPVAWFSTMPFYTALTVQHGYFASNKVTLLAANYGEPQRGHGGSGIYVAKGNIAHIDINGAAGNTLIVHDIQKSKRKANRKNCVTTTSFGRHISNKPADISNYLTYRDFKAADYQFQDVDLTRREVSTEICHGQICCSFNITAEQPPNTKEVYKLMAYEGKVIFDRSYVYIRVCSLLACQNETRDSCGARVNGTTKFTKISVDGRVPKDGTTFYTPITLNYGLRPMLETTYCDGAPNVKLSANSAQTGVLVFGIFGKNDSAIL